MEREFKYEAVSMGEEMYLVIKYYVSPTIGKCHVDYTYIAAPSADAAVVAAQRSI